MTCFELPVYRPSAAERADPKLYAANVRKLMVSGSCCAWGPLARAEEAAEVARACGSGGSCGRRARRHPWLAWRAPLWVGGEPQLAAFRLRPAQHSLSCVSLPLPTPPTRRAPGQLDFAGLQPTAATYHDKMDLMKRLKAEYGLE